MDAPTLYEWICREPDTKAAVAGLDTDALRALHHYLAPLSSGGIPRDVHALVIGQAALRILEP